MIGFPIPTLLLKDTIVNIFIVVKKIDQNKHGNNKIIDFEIFCTHLYQIEVIYTKIFLAFIQYDKNKKDLDAKMQAHEFISLSHLHVSLHSAWHCFLMLLIFNTYFSFLPAPDMCMVEPDNFICCLRKREECFSEDATVCS